MSTLFDDLQEGLIQTIDHVNGKTGAKSVTYIIWPIRKYDKDQIREPESW